MKMQKVFMIVVLILFVGLIVFALFQVNNKSEEKVSQNQQNTQTISSAANTANTANSNNNFTNANAGDENANSNSGTVRKSTQKVEADMNNITEITDNFFIEQTNDVYYNLGEYVGKTIKIEGFVSNYKDKNNDTCYCVVRNTPGCCGSDGLAGLDIRYDGEYPELKTWVEVIGVIGKDTAFGDEIPAIQVTSITPKAEGKTFVTN